MLVASFVTDNCMALWGIVKHMQAEVSHCLQPETQFSAWRN